LETNFDAVNEREEGIKNALLSAENAKKKCKIFNLIMKNFSRSKIRT
jgi:hypothetical protein